MKGLGIPPPPGKLFDRRLDLLRCLRQSGCAVGSGVLDPVVLRRIVRRGKVDRSRGFQCADREGDGGGGRSFRNHDRRDPGTGQHTRRFGYKALAQEARVTAYQHPVRLGKRLHVLCNSGHRQPDIRYRKFIRHNGSPSRGAKLDRCAHSSLHARRHRISSFGTSVRSNQCLLSNPQPLFPERLGPQGPYCNTGAGSATT